MNPEELLQLIENARAAIAAKLINTPELQKPRAMIICGSGLGGIASILRNEPKIEMNYAGIPGFAASTVQGHSGKLVFGLIGKNSVPVMCMVGRLHFYEGYSLDQTTFPVRVGHALGVDTVVVTNAAGGLRKDLVPGDLMLITDHINFPGLAGNHPLRGPNLDTLGPRFLGLLDAYDHDLGRSFVQNARRLGVSRVIAEGTYAYVSGPSFESRAEVRMLRTMGADAVGMSTVPEVIIARHCGLKVLALSLITNAGLGDVSPSVLDDNARPLSEGMANHAEVLEAAAEASLDVQKIMEATIGEL